MIRSSARRPRVFIDIEQESKQLPTIGTELQSASTLHTKFSLAAVTGANRAFADAGAAAQMFGSICRPPPSLLLEEQPKRNIGATSHWSTLFERIMAGGSAPRA